MNFLSLLAARMGGSLSLIRVRYKSGAYEDFYVRQFSIKIVGGDKEVKWKLVDGAKRPMYFGLDNVESVWELKYWSALFYNSHDHATKKA